ncbi:serine/threonine-protein kinase [Yinghuangia seranimata]|uniref:serine/threonine-protein kinase n=1 Tax=Yinghuangia seranimata TaxID=408067 RepID=UPI00248CEDF3|nr:serine/threonine-protein kinase [Yinghuangia seranimata]MDI2132838.1 serine/threonine-protein kinase [Yinghuangia seranimata]
MEPLTSDDPLQIGSYRLLARLGAGGMGRVYLGRSPHGRMAAVKVVHAQLAQDAEFRARFRAEVRSARLLDGRWTAPVLDADSESDTPWLATGYVSGMTLHDAVASHGPLPEWAVWSLAAGFAEALAHIHERGLLHRDLKPSNVMLTLDGPRVIDFGIARSADASIATRTGMTLGSPAYMSPEQIQGGDLGVASDVFSFGSVLAFAATGRAPFGVGDSGGYAVMLRVTTDAPDLAGVPESLLPLIGSCLDKSPGARPAVAEIRATAAEASRASTADTWLPAALTAEIGRRSARLLDVEDPTAPHGRIPEPPVGNTPPPMPASLPTVGYGGAPPHMPPPHMPPPHTPPRAPAHTPPPAPPTVHAVPHQPPPQRRLLVPVLAAVCVLAVLTTALVVGLTWGGGNDGASGSSSSAGPGTVPAAPQTSAPAQPGTDTRATGTSAKPFTYSGTWSGVLTQRGSEKYTVTVVFSTSSTGAAPGDQIATVDYPGLTCGGRWVFVAARDTGAAVREEITRNATTRCTAFVDITLTRSGSDQLVYETSAGGGIVGTLTRNG